MNHCYRLVWSQVHSAWVAVTEIARSRGKTKSSKALSPRPQAGEGLGVRAVSMLSIAPRAALLLALSPAALAATVTAPDVNALPTGGVVAAGSATIGSVGNVMNVNQATQRAVLNWQSFDIGSNATVNFVQPNANAVALNRVLGNNASRIYGNLNANGHVFLLNQHGTYFAPGSQVNVGGLVASTMEMADNDFMNNSSNSLSNAGGGLIEALGNINAGSVALVGNNISNSGNIIATTVSLVSGDTVAVDLTGNNLIRARVVDPALSASIANSGTIQAAMVTMSAGQAQNALNSVVNNSGTIIATTLANKGGDIYLEAHTVSNTGLLDASGTTGGGTVYLMGDMGTGHVNVGGNIKAQATQSGNGGFVETSAAYVKVADEARVNTLAANGLNGSWLIDPVDFTVAASGGDMTATAVQTALGLGNFSILSSGGGSGTNGDININENISWSVNQLSLSAARDININAVMTASGTSSLVMTTATSVPGGIVRVGISGGNFIGRVDFTGRSGTGFLTINTNPYFVINSLGASGSMTGTDLQGIQGNLSGYFALGDNIDASATSGWNAGAGFTPVGANATPFTGTFDGLGHTISNLFINQPGTNDMALFGNTTGASISNLGLTGGSITGNVATGGLVGYGVSTNINNSYMTGTVSGNNNVGGLAGTFNSGSINYSFASGNVTALGNSAGGLVGHSGSSTIGNTYATGNVTGVNRVGGLVGHNYGTISMSHAAGDATASTQFAGGLVGINAIGGSISNSHAAGSTVTTGVNHAGGLVGLNVGGATISASYATSDVSAGNRSAGGLVGTNYGTINNNHAGGNVTGNTYVGGLVGQNYGTISNSYATTGTVNGVNDVGGLVGLASSGSINNSYAEGNVTATGSASNRAVGGLVGTNNGTVNNSYSSGDVTGNVNVGGLIGKESGSSINSYYDISVVSINGTNHVTPYGIYHNQYLDWVTGMYAALNPVTYLGATVGGYYQLDSLTDLQNMLAFTNKIDIVNFKLTANLDLAALPDWHIPFLAGELNGNGFTFSNLSVSQGFNSRLGLVGTAVPGVLIEDVGVIGGSVTGFTNVGGLVGYNYGGVIINNSHSSANVIGVSGSNTAYSVGGLVGYNNYGTISNSHATGNVTGNLNTGGLAGTNYGTISNSYATGSVSGGDYNTGGLVGTNYGAGSINNSFAIGNVSGGNYNTGGLVGHNYGTLSDSLATGSVTGNHHVGGLVGRNYGSGTIDNSYAVGSVTGSTYLGGLVGFDSTSNITNSFWDMDTSGLLTSAGGTGLTTAQMQTASTFVTASWDTATIWTVTDGAYPILQGLPDPYNLPSGGGGGGDDDDGDNDFLDDVNDITNSIISGLDDDINGNDDDDDENPDKDNGDDFFKPIKLALVSEDGVESLLELEVPKGKVLTCQ